MILPHPSLDGNATMEPMNSEPPRKLEEITVDKDRFDAILKKIIATKPLPLKDVIGTSPRRKRAESAS
jgi:hypothetical protein